METEKINTQITETEQENINDVIDRLYENNENFKSLKKVIEADKTMVKTYVLNHDIANNTIQTDNAMATVVEVNKQTYKEKEFIEFLEKYEIPGLIEYKPVINMDALEDSIHHGYIAPADIEPFIITETTYRLDIKKPKK